MHSFTEDPVYIEGVIEAKKGRQHVECQGSPMSDDSDVEQPHHPDRLHPLLNTELQTHTFLQCLYLPSPPVA